MHSVTYVKVYQVKLVYLNILQCKVIRWGLVSVSGVTPLEIRSPLHCSNPLPVIWIRLGLDFHS